MAMSGVVWGFGALTRDSDATRGCLVVSVALDMVSMLRHESRHAPRRCWRSLAYAPHKPLAKNP